MNSPSVSYEFYRNEYFGESVSSENEFKRLERIAMSKIRQYVGDSDISEVEDIGFCVCELVDNEKAAINSAGKSSETVGSYSVTYDKSKSAGDSVTYNIIVRYFGNTGLLYRGIPYVH